MANTILIISSDVPFRARVSFLLQEAEPGVDVVYACTAAEASEVVSPHLVVIDLLAPEPWLLEYCRRIRELCRIPWLPVIQLVLNPSDASASALDQTTDANIILSRSIDDTSLVSTVKSLYQASILCNSRYDRETPNREVEIDRDALKNINERSVSLLESITDGFYSLDREWRFTYFNSAAERISGRTRAEVIGRVIWEVFPESVTTVSYDYYHEAVRDGISKTYDLYYAPLDVWLEINIYPSPEGLSAYYREITGRKRAEATLSSYAAQQTAIALVGERALSGASLPELLHETATHVAHTLGAEYVAVFELQPETSALLLTAGVGWVPGLVGQTSVPAGPGTQFGYILEQEAPVLANRLPADTRLEVAPLLRESGITSDLAAVIYGQEGPYGVLSAHSAHPREFTPQEVTFIQSVANILAAAIQRRRLEESLRQSQVTLARAQEIARIGTWSVDAVTGAVYWSDEMYRIFGVSPERFSPTLQQIATRVHPDDRERASEFVRMALREGAVPHLEHRIVLDNGECRWIRIQAERTEDPGSGPVRLVGTVLDITERKRGEEALRESEERYRVLFDRSPIPKMLYDEETLRFLAVNEAALEHYGYSRDEFLEMHLANLWSPGTEPELPSIRELPAHASVHVNHLKKDGTTSEVEIFAQRVLLSGRPAGILVAQDITDRTQLEAQLRQAQKMEAVGRLAGGVAHDFNNMLAVIAGYSELLLLLTDTDDRRELQGPLLEIQKASERATRLTRQLLAFSRKQVLSPKVLDVGALVLDFEPMLSRLIGEDIEVAVRVAPNLHQVKADPGQLEQVLLNLVVNSRDAMPTGGKITIEVQNAELGPEYLKRHPAVGTGEYVLLAVTDSGCGMSAETLEHAFEPFFTTKAAEHGTGLGLATVFGIVQQSDGHVDLYSEVGIGTTFKIYLPRTRTVAESAVKPQATVLRGDATVLLVEDEEMVRSLVQEVLVLYGYTVLAAANGHEALQVAEQLAPHVDLLLTDVVMPGGVGGRQLAQELRHRWPHLKVLYMSGYTDDAVVRHGIIEADTAFIQKPFTPHSLARKVREVLG